MYYRINVSRYGKHYFCTGNTICTEDHMLEVYRDLCKAFKESKGYEVSVCMWSKVGKDITIIKGEVV